MDDRTEFHFDSVDDFSREVARARHNAKLLAFLEERGERLATKSLAEVKSDLGLD